MLELLFEMMQGITVALCQALAETWLWLVLGLIVAIIGLLATKPWNYKSMRAWLRSLEK